ncbi:MAG TPA: hypothetical protein VFS77_07400 [Pyrinomonadaceae bacterium]|nr:hypothetical protein [Pyrinomonadaceae bacterium]
MNVARSSDRWRFRIGSLVLGYFSTSPDAASTEAASAASTDAVVYAEGVG